MKAIVVYRNFHDLCREELMPEIYLIDERESPEYALRKLWNKICNDVIIENLNGSLDPLDEENCWYKNDMALITWADGDTEELYVVDIKESKPWR